MPKPTIILDEEFVSLMRSLSEEELAGLEAGLIAGKYCDPIVLWGDILLDGHHRYRICQEQEIPFTVRKIDLPDRLAAIKWIVQSQLGRRNLTAKERATYVLRLKPEIAKAAKARMMAGKRPTLGDKLPQGQTSAILGEIANVSARTVRSAMSETTPKAKPGPKPKEPEAVLDETGRAVPSDRAKGLIEAFQRRGEITSLMHQLTMIKSKVLQAVEKEDPLYKFVLGTRFDADMGNVYRMIRFAAPYAVCPYCAGDGCKACKGGGWVGKLMYDHAPAEGKTP